MNYDIMTHGSNCLNSRMLKLGHMLGLKPKDIQALQKKVVNSERRTAPILVVQNPVSSYKDIGGSYYGTISILDF